MCPRKIDKEETMGAIHILDQDTINKIAAGEVVERPLSVIKELIENAIDAKANAITVEIEEGGLRLIRITDNGHGMDKEDVNQAFVRHATSKITVADDLNRIASLGFRGEALASIAAVSMVECMTKTRDALTGIRYQINGGKELGLSEIGCPEGTTFVVRELFYNVPARKKFLKSAKTEGSYVTDLMYRMALSHPGISFKYIINNKVKLHTSGNFSLKDCIYQIFGKEYAKHSLEVDYEYGDYSITGYVGEAMLSRGNRQYEIYFVNGRYVKSKWIQRGIEAGVKDGMMINQYPFAVLFLRCHHNLVDVNVHPNKMDVRFHDEEKVMEHVREAILTALTRQEPVSMVGLPQSKEEKEASRQEKQEMTSQLKEAPEPFEVHRRIQQQHDATKRQESQSRSVQTEPTTSEMLKDKSLDLGDSVKGHESDQEQKNEKHDVGSKPLIEPMNEDAAVELEKKKLPNKASDTMPEKIQEHLNLERFLDEQKIRQHKIIGQAFKTYWIVEYKKELYIIDQHAAHEKVLYETWVQKVEEGNLAGQMLLEPFVLQVSEREMAIYEKFAHDLAALGFDVEIFGELTLIIKSVPYLLNEPLPATDFVKILDQMVEEERGIAKSDHYLHELATVACKAAIKGNDRLSHQEYESLIEQLLTLNDPYHCPHGRPTMVRMSQYELEKRFKRIT